MKHKFLSLLAVIAVAASLTACQAEETGQYLELVDEVVSETGQDIQSSEALSNATVSETTTTDSETSVNQIEKDYSDYEEFPEGWSAERVLNMISIDGHQLSFPCTVDDILALSEDFEIGKGRTYSENIKMAYLFCDDIQVATIFFYNNLNVHYININDFSKSGYVTVENIDLNDTEKITKLIENLTTKSTDEFGLISGNYIESQTAITIHYYSETNSLSIFWEEIK